MKLPERYERLVLGACIAPAFLPLFGFSYQETIQLPTCNSSATRMPMYGALTVIILQKFNSVSRSLIIISTELQLLSFVSFQYKIWKHPTTSHVNDESAPTRDALSIASTLSLTRPVSPRLADVREPRKGPLPPLWNKIT